VSVIHEKMDDDAVAAANHLKWNRQIEKKVSSVANDILNNALHVYFLSNESNTLADVCLG
jgi:hypothetical protein